MKQVLSNQSPVQVYTDGSCHTQLCIGGWVAILFIEGEKIILSGKVLNTTHNRMELTAVIKAIEYVRENYRSYNSIQINTDSQYVTGLSSREEKLSAKNFITTRGNEIRNVDLVKELLEHTGHFNIKFVKIKAHQRKGNTVNFNIEADQLSRQIVRDAVKEIS